MPGWGMTWWGVPLSVPLPQPLPARPRYAGPAALLTSSVGRSISRSVRMPPRPRRESAWLALVSGVFPLGPVGHPHRISPVRLGSDSAPLPKPLREPPPQGAVAYPGRAGVCYGPPAGEGGQTPLWPDPGPQGGTRDASPGRRVLCPSNGSLLCMAFSLIILKKNRMHSGVSTAQGDSRAHLARLHVASGLLTTGYPKM